MHSLDNSENSFGIKFSDQLGRKCMHQDKEIYGHLYSWNNMHLYEEWRSILCSRSFKQDRWLQLPRLHPAQEGTSPPRLQKLLGGKYTSWSLKATIMVSVRSPWKRRGHPLTDIGALIFLATSFLMVGVFFSQMFLSSVRKLRDNCQFMHTFAFVRLMQFCACSLNPPKCIIPLSH